MKIILWVFIVVLAIFVGTIPVFYLIGGVNQGYLELKTEAIKGSKIWWFFLYTHIISGGIAIIIGWVQFNKKIQKKYLTLHRNIGKVYIISALICSISGIYIGFFATGGIVPAMGFILIGIIYFYTTLKGFLFIKKGEITNHQNMMTYSYAACLAAVSLRIFTPISFLLELDYITSYAVIAWISWLPNLAIAYWINQSRMVNQI